MGGITSKEKFEKEPIASNEKENKVAKRGAKETVASSQTALCCTRQFAGCDGL
jgi:hypothetical protein